MLDKTISQLEAFNTQKESAQPCIGPKHGGESIEGAANMASNKVAANQANNIASRK